MTKLSSDYEGTVKKLTDEQLKKLFNIQQTMFGFVVSFVNAYDGKVYSQSTIYKNAITMMFPKKILRNSEEYSVSKSNRYKMGPYCITCDTVTVEGTSMFNVRKLMHCAGAFRMRLPMNVLKIFALDMANVFQNTEMARVLSGSASDEFDKLGYGSIFTKMRLDFKRPWRRIPFGIMLGSKLMEIAIKERNNTLHNTLQ